MDIEGRSSLTGDGWPASMRVAPNGSARRSEMTTGTFDTAGELTEAERLDQDHSGRRARQLLTVDLEEYFHDLSLQDLVRPEEWSSLPSRGDRSLGRLLPLLERRDATATFFVVGWLAKERPDLVRRIADAGHEVASHGHFHRSPAGLHRDGFRSELRASREAILDATGVQVSGYRAPGAPLDEVPEWFFGVLADEGFRYDSSLSAPMWRRPLASRDRTPPEIVKERAGDVLEIPIPTLRILGAELLTLGGASLRQLSVEAVEQRLRHIEERRECVAVQVRSWELDPGAPRLPRDWLTRLRKYRNLGALPRRLEALLGGRSFESVSERFGLDAVPPSSDERAAGESSGDVRQTG